MLTNDDLTLLKKWFEPNDHEFIRGFAYLQEDAITERIERVDPAWSMTEPFISIRDSAFTDSKTGEVTVTTMISVKVGITIKDVTRWGIGSAIVESGRSEAEKSAVTDALKRASRLFGIGRYLLTLPSNVKSVADLDRWMSGNSKPKSTQDSQRNAQSTQQKQSTAQTGKTPENAVQGDSGNTPHWIADKATQGKFWAYARTTLGLSDMDVHMALKVSESVYEYQGTKEDAMRDLLAYVDEMTAKREVQF